MLSMLFRSGPSLRRLVCSASVLLISTGFASAAQAQTAPDLLPYKTKLVAGGGTALTAGATCPVSGNTSTDAYGDGCLATEVALDGARYAVTDAAGNLFIADYGDGLIRRVDAVTGVITTIAGGASSSPASGTTCGAYTSADMFGDGCLSTAVKLGNPAGLAFDPAGDLYFADPYDYNVRMIAATAGLIPPAGGVITLVDGDDGGTVETYGYTSDNSTAKVVAATSSYLDAPYGVAFDPAGNLYIADEYKDAIVVVNTNATGSTTVTGVTIPAGTVAKIVGTLTGGGTSCPNGSGGKTVGCNYGLWVNGAQANASLTDAPWAPTFDSQGNVYFANEYEDNIGVISAAGVINNFAGEQGSLGKGLANTKRGTAGTFAIGGSLGIAADAEGNVYIPDETNGFVWRVDAGSNAMYVVAGGATTVCSGATDTFGDGCPALQSTFGSNGTYGSNTSLGLYGVSVDASADLFVTDPKNNVVREVSSGTQFGNISVIPNPPTDTVDVHFAAGDSPASAGAYTITTGSSIFTVGTAACTTNSDNTVDCLVPITAAPTVLGPFSGTLQVTSAAGATASFPLSGDYVSSPNTRTTAAVVGAGASCSGVGLTYVTGTAVTLSANVISSGAPTGTVQFYANGNPIPAASTGQSITNNAATLSYAFPTAGTYTITAVYSGDSYYLTSTSAPVTVTIAAPSFTVGQSALASGGTTQPGCPPGTVGQCTVAPGQTALYSFTVSGAYGGTISFACSGLPAETSCSFSPVGSSPAAGTVTTLPCTSQQNFALSILTQAPVVAMPAGVGLGRGRWGMFTCMLCALSGLLMMRKRQRKAMLRIALMVLLLAGSTGLVACGGGAKTSPGTPTGSYTVTVTATGSVGNVTSTVTVPLIVKNS
jgi:hypothetical protein